MHYCLNVVTEDDKVGTAVLIRGVEPIEGLDLLAQNRYAKKWNELSNREKKNITNGPGKLCQALGLDKSSNGESLLRDNIYISKDDSEESIKIVHAKRVNIDYAEEAANYDWRYYIQGNSYVSRK